MDTVGGGGGAGMGYPDSLDSSPRSRGGESWDEPFPPSAAAKLRLMCSYGGRIVPRPTDKSLCYLNGETRIVVVERHSSLAELSARLSHSLLNGRTFTLKYQLPNEDLDSLISVTTDEDLENMIEEYDRIAAAAGSGGKSTRLRLFLFPSKSDSTTSSISSLLDDSKSDNWFVDALNGAMGITGMTSMDTASVNSLLGLESETAAPPPALARPESSGKLGRQDVHSVPDSPMLDTTSSFGSTSSAPSLSNLPPIRVRPADDRPPDPQIADHFAHMNISSAAAASAAAAPPVHHPASTPPNISPTENPTRTFSSDEDGIRKQQPPPPQPQQQKSNPMDTPISDSLTRPMYAAAVTNTPIHEPQKLQREVPVSDPSYQGYMMQPMQQPDQLHQQQLHQHHQQQQHQQQQQQFIQHNPPHYVHPATGAVLPYPPYYQVPHQPMQQTQQPHPYDQQIPMYYLPVQRQNAPYNLAPGMQPNLGETAALPIPPAAVKPAASIPKLPAKPEPQANLMYRTGAPAAAAAALQPMPPNPLIHMTAADQTRMYAGMGYQVMHHQHPSQSSAAMMPPPNYAYEYAAAPQADPSHPPQMYYTQSTSPPAMAPQYQTVVSSAGNIISDPTVVPQLQPGEVKQTRAS